VDETLPEDNGPGLNVMLDNKLPLISDCEELIGFAVDEIGGVWSFQPATNEEYSEYRAKVEARKKK
jgi:hypothetical protein